MAEALVVTPEQEKALTAVHPLWTYGCNDHLDLELSGLPADFAGTGFLKQDFGNVCQLLGAVPHPSFKIKLPPGLKRSPRDRPAMPVSSTMQRRMSRMGSDCAQRSPVTLANDKEDYNSALRSALASTRLPQLAVRSSLLDRATMQIFSLLLPACNHLRSLIFSECRLDSDMLGLLRRGLQGQCTVEAVQIEWNPLEMPLPTSEEVAAATCAEPGDGDESVAQLSLEARERHRYRMQSLRCLHCFRSWLADLGGGSLHGAWAALAGGAAAETAALSSGEFHDALETALGAAGPQVAEAFDVLDGPDYAGGRGRVSIAELRTALEGLPEETPEQEQNDPIGRSWADFFDGHCVLESLSLRACGVDWPDVLPIAQALEQCPWQLRCLNLWDNRIADRGATRLAEALDQYRGLEYLGLGRNRISDAGLAALCRPYQAVSMDEAGKAAAQAKIAEQEGLIVAKAKAAAKAKPKADSKPGRFVREATLFVDVLEERPPVLEGGEPSYVHRRPSDLKVLVLSENPVKNARTIEALQPFGPKGVELLLKQTPAATALLAKRPELASTKERRPFCPGGEGWVVRIA